MIPADVANSLKQPLLGQQLSTDAPTRPVSPAQQIADVLSDLVPGQRILAEIQALLPNGTYRAIVAQRDVTLALPFSAKPGDTLELEVAESDGKLTLAFVANRTDGTTPKTPPESVSTSLSSAGKLIGNLLNEIGVDGRKAPPVPLNNAQPLVDNMPKTAADLAPVLKQAVTQSGMFYEAHQARWVAGELPTESLRQEPQGKLPVQGAQIPNAAVDAETRLDRDIAPGARSPQSPNATVEAENRPKSVFSAAVDTTPIPVKTSVQAGSEAPASINHRIPNELTPLVQQQLDGLSTQNFAWQGQIWPGQQMWWEIGRDQQRGSTPDDPSRPWQTRLKLTLPLLGQIEAALELNAGGEVGITLQAANAASEARLRDNAPALTSQLEAAGLRLTQLSLKQHDQAGQ